MRSSAKDKEHTLLIEGWRGVNHSYALVNQNQILALRNIPNVRLFHRDLPFAFEGRNMTNEPRVIKWTRHDNTDAFSEDDRRLLDALVEPDPDLDRIDATYRICSPFRAGNLAKRTINFLAAEVGLGPAQFVSKEDLKALLASENGIVTPSEWSCRRTIEGGFRYEQVTVVAHGVDRKRFQPPIPSQRSIIRRDLGIAEDEILFVSVAAPFWHKGTDLLLRAFAVLRQRGTKVRLLVKDQRALYGRRLEDVLDELGRRDERLRDERVKSGILTIGANLAPERLSDLYGAADCYVSPYRGEGFNLPVLEGIACGLPAIVTAGGATDDFCDDAVSIKIPGCLTRSRNTNGSSITYIEPEFDSLVDAMTLVAAGSRPEPNRFDMSRQALLERFSWSNAAAKIVRLAFDQT